MALDVEEDATSETRQAVMAVTVANSVQKLSGRRMARWLLLFPLVVVTGASCSATLARWGSGSRHDGAVVAATTDAPPTPDPGDASARAATITPSTPTVLAGAAVGADGAPEAAGESCPAHVTTPSPESANSAGTAAADDDAEDDSQAATGGVAADNDERAGDGETESRESVPGAKDTGPRYTADLSDSEIEKQFVENPAQLGSMSVGFADEGRLINGVQMPCGEGWEVLVPEYAWGTQETIASLETAGRLVTERFGEPGHVRVVHIGRKEGGYLRPHHSHQSGRDVDLALYYRADPGPGKARDRWLRVLDPAINWQLIKALVSQTDVQLILVDHRIQSVLYDYALSQGEDKAWLDSLFHGSQALIMHARGHRDHFHVRFYNPRSQELGRRIQPFLARRPDENLAIYRVRSGDTLGAIARRYNSSVAMIEKANGMHSSFLRLSRTLVVPLRGPCTQCPLPPPVIVPPRRVPPPPAVSAAPTAPARPELQAVVSVVLPTVAPHAMVELQPGGSSR